MARGRYFGNRKRRGKQKKKWDTKLCERCAGHGTKGGRNGTKPCPVCGLEVPAHDLQECTICRSVCCEYCVIFDFGRSFCSSRCRGFFFWGDGDQDEKDF
jgi:hypothetical protein